MGIGFQQYLGLDSAHLVSLKRQDGGSELLIENGALQAFRALQSDASKHGFVLEACSAYRGFSRQAQLFGAKFLGQRPILDRNEQVIAGFIEDPVQRMRAILVFSAMPGFSRHHFGSDLDIYAPNLLPKGQSLQLTYHEYLEGSYFYELGLYLKESLHLFDFANPYAVQSKDKKCLECAEQGSVSQQAHVIQSSQGKLSSKAQPTGESDKVESIRDGQSSLESGVSQAHTQEQGNKSALATENTQASDTTPQVGYEPWHISHLPSARPYLQAYDIEVALDYVAQQDLPYAPWVKEVMSREQIEAMLRFDIC